MFDIGFFELMALLVIALFVFGPDKLPKFAAEAGRLLRQLRAMAQGAKDEVTGSLGPEFSDLQLTDLDPRNFVKRHLLEESEALDAVLKDEPVQRSGSNGDGPAAAPKAVPYDGDAT